MKWADATRRTEVLVAWIVAAGVAAAGIYDFQQGQAPRGKFDVNPTAGQALFLASCLLTALTATALTTVGPSPSRRWLRLLLVATSLVPAVLADPTYGSLLLAVPLIDIRRRDLQPARTLWTVVVCGAGAWLVLTERTPRVVAEYEAMFVLAIAYAIIVLLGDALRSLDQGVESETRLAQLTERARVADDLHDSVGHHLLASSIQLQKAQALRTIDPDSASQAVDLASQAVNDAIAETRLIVDAVRHQQTFRIEPALRDLTRRIIPTGTSVTMDVQGDHDRIDQDAQLALYRVAQEALSNLVRHSSATSAHIVSSVTTDSVVLKITDDGAGFDPNVAKRPGGLDNMRRRVSELGGTFEITTSLDGTSVHATVPR